MATISWDESKPAGQDSLGVGDDQIRSDKTAIRVAIDTEHIFPSTGGDAGVHRIGSARPYYGVQSLVSSSGTDARLMQTSDTSRLFHVGSAGTVFLGGPTVISAGSYPGTVPQRAYWAMEFGAAGAFSSGQTTITFPNSGYSGQPFVVAVPWDNSQNFAALTVHTITATTFKVNAFNTAGAPQSSVSVMWYSLGTRTF